MNWKQYLFHLTTIVYTYFFLSCWDTPTPELVAIDPTAINRWIYRTNLRFNIYWNEFNYWLKIFEIQKNICNSLNYQQLSYESKWPESIEKLIEKNITKEDIIQLAIMNWVIDDENECLACFV